MLNECLDGLKLTDNGVYVDATIGGGGHSSKILGRTKNAKVIGIDQDQEALEASAKRLDNFRDRLILVHSNFSNLADVLNQLKISKVDGVLIDLGVSSYQIDNPERGFSFRFDSPLDMRMNQQEGLSAYEVVNDYSEAQLKKLIFDYGEERFAPRVARRIVEQRSKSKIETTLELKNIILSAVGGIKGNNALDSVQRVFQAIRIEVNNELGVIEKTIDQAVSCLKSGGRLVILTFHSLEDRIVKNAFKRLSTNCTCPPEFPVCICGGKNAKIKLINSKPITASGEEQKANSRSLCAKLRIAEKI